MGGLHCYRRIGQKIGPLRVGTVFGRNYFQ